MRRLRAALVAAAVAALAFATWIATTASVRRADEPSVAAHRAEMVAEVRLAAAAVNDWLAESRAQLAAVREALNGVPNTSARAVLDREKSRSNFDGFALLDHEGVVRSTSSGPLTNMSDQPRRDPAVDAALAGADGVSDVTRDRLTRIVAIEFTTPLPGRGALVGYTNVPSGTLSARIGMLAQSLYRPLAVVTAGGTVVTSTADEAPAPGQIIRADAGLTPAIAAAKTGPTHVSYTGEGGEPTVAAAAPLADGWAIVAPRPAASVAVTGERATTAASAALAGVLVAAAAAIIGLLTVLRARSAKVEEAKQAFLAIAGHELRTPLTVMKGYTDLLVDSWDDIPDEARQNVIETVSYQVRNLEHLVERLLFGAQLEAGVAPSTSREEVTLAPLLEEIADHQRGIAPLHTFAVGAPADVRVLGDTKALEHVVTNLVENAVKYSPEGGAVTIAANTAKGRVRLTVDDEGIGLPADLEGIFDKFVQREAVDTRVHDEGGVGLGLFIVKTLVEQMGGTVRAEHLAPRGARFVVTLRNAAR